MIAIFFSICLDFWEWPVEINWDWDRADLMKEEM